VIPTRHLLARLFLISAAGGCLIGALLGTVASLDLSPAGVVGTMMMAKQTVRIVCSGPEECTPYVPASSFEKCDLCGHSSALWSAAIGGALMSSALFSLGLLWAHRRQARANKTALEAASTDPPAAPITAVLLAAPPVIDASAATAQPSEITT
jgi:hypothetical protein